jgi:hypothetical protein
MSEVQSTEADIAASQAVQAALSATNEAQSAVASIATETPAPVATAEPATQTAQPVAVAEPATVVEPVVEHAQTLEPAVDHSIAAEGVKTDPEPELRTTKNPNPVTGRTARDVQGRRCASWERNGHDARRREFHLAPEDAISVDFMRINFARS